MASYEPVRQAWQLAISGDPDSARVLLEEAKPNGLPVEGADLLARLAIRQGRFAEARGIWGALLSVDPTYGPALRAVACLDSPRIFRALAWKLARLVALMTGALLACIGIWALWSGIPSSDAASMLTAWLALTFAFLLVVAGAWLLVAYWGLRNPSAMGRLTNASTLGATASTTNNDASSAGRSNEEDDPSMRVG
jgi:hypothetical protein